MDYSRLSDFEINKRVAEACGLLIQEVDDNSGLGMTTEFHDKYPSVVWVAHLDCGTGQQCEPWWQFDACNSPEDAWPIIVDNYITISPVQKTSNCIGVATVTDEWQAGANIVVDGEIDLAGEYFGWLDKKPLRAAMIVYLMMQESNPSTLQSPKQGF